MADGCEVDLSNLEIQNSTKIYPSPETMIGNARVWDLRELKNVIIPEGTERIGNSWFCSCGIESVEIPASVKCIDACAFYNCKSLKSVAFAEGSRLEKIWPECFRCTGIEEFLAPQSLREIGNGAFYECEKLKSVSFQEGSMLERIGAECFAGSGLKEITLPESVKEVGADAFYECE